MYCLSSTTIKTGSKSLVDVIFNSKKGDLPSKMDNISRVAQCNVDSNCSIHEMVENYEKSLIIDVLRK
ncbi:hypothetical protein ACTPEM_23570, partial [Clostridioides difficile]